MKVGAGSNPVPGTILNLSSRIATFCLQAQLQLAKES